jgi:deazaflavin-dependent oxidoreductase (nitroreductase family)
LIETVGRVSGAPVTAAVGFAEDDDGTLHVAAGSDSSDWALNLRADPRCRVTIGDRVAPYVAAEEDEGERGRTVTQLILKYGTPAERLGHGPTFRLVPEQ